MYILHYLPCIQYILMHIILYTHSYVILICYTHILYIHYIHYTLYIHYIQVTPSPTTSPRSAAHSPDPSPSCGTCEWQGSSQTLWVTCIMTSTMSAWSYTELDGYTYTHVLYICYVFVHMLCACIPYTAIVGKCLLFIHVIFAYTGTATILPYSLYTYTYTYTYRSQAWQHRFHLDRNPKTTR